MPHKVPKFDFTNFNFITPPTLPGFGGNLEFLQLNSSDFKRYYYRGPSRIVDRVSSAVAAEGEILNIKPPALNASWTADFYGTAAYESTLCKHRLTMLFRQGLTFDVTQSLQNNATISR